jgi:hypothetical protein
MDDSPKSNIQINQSQLSELQRFLKTGNVFPVTIEKQIAANYYAIKIRNVALNAFSEVDLRSKKVFVRVKESSPVPKLQLLFYDDDAKVSMWDDLDDQINYHDFIKLRQVMPYLPKSEKMPDAQTIKALLYWLDVKSGFSIIPLASCFKSELSITQLQNIYSYYSLSSQTTELYRYPAHIVPYESDFSNLDSFNQYMSSENFRLERWYVPVKNQILSLPIETLYYQHQLFRFCSCLNTENYGQIRIDAIKKSNWKIQIDFENSIYQRSFVPELQAFSDRISQQMKQTIDLNFGLIEINRYEQPGTMLDTIIRN